MMQEIGFNYNVNELKKCIGRFPETNILVIGDIILDEYIWGDVSRISPRTCCGSSRRDKNARWGG